MNISTLRQTACNCNLTSLRFASSLVRNFVLALLFVSILTPAISQRKVERLTRGVVAARVNTSNVFISWRLLGTEPTNLGFNIYRDGVKLNASPLAGGTNYTDATTLNATYTVVPVVGTDEQTPYPSGTTTPWAKQYKQIPLQIPEGGVTPTGEVYTYNANDASVADLDGDGDYEIILKWDPSNSKDNSQSGYTGNVYIDAYKMNGTLLWRIDLGRNIRAGAHYTQFLVYDFDSDGKAEMVCKTADGTKDGVGTTIGSSTADYRNTAGYVLSGPEFLTIFNGMTGAAMSTVNYVPARGTVSNWGDSYGNRVDRFIAAVAYLDGVNPSIVMGRGYYTRMVRAAWDWRNGVLTQRWVFDTGNTSSNAYYSQGNHQMTVGDMDGDGKDEVCNGASTINDNGTGLYSTGLGHGDALHMSDMDLDRPGQEVWQCYEEQARYGTNGLGFRDAKTGATLWGVPTTGDIGRAMAADVDPRYKGYEVWGSAGGLFTCKGVQVSTSRPSVNHAVYWDGDLQRELLDGTKLEKWNYTTNSLNRLLTLYQPELGSGESNNGTKANPALTADLFGDWREEIILRSYDNQFLNIYTTVNPTATRIYTLMHDPQYRVAVAWQNSGYNQPPHPSFYIGEQMAAPPIPNIVMVSPGPLPVKLLAFNAAPQGRDVLINWKATGEVNSKQYELERSVDGVNFTLVTIVKDKGNTGTENSYSYVDRYPVSLVNYYRLKQVDLDGRFVYSAVKKVQFTNKVGVTIFPNPASSTVQVKLNSTKNISWLRVYNAEGKLLLDLEKVNSTQATVDLSRFVTGAYFMKISDGIEVVTEKVWKQ